MENKIKKQFTCIVCDKTFVKKEKGLKERVCCSTSCAAKLRGMMRKEELQNKIDEIPEHKAWLLFWSYECPRMERKLLNEQNNQNYTLPPIPSNSVELATYKICEVKFYTDTFYPYLPSLEERAKMGQH